MDRNMLLTTAQALQAPSKASQEEYEAKSEILNSMINDRLLKRKDIKALVGDNIDMMKDNHANHIRFMSSIFQDYQPEVFLDTILWVFRAYRSHQFTSNYWAAQMNTWMQLLKSELSEASYKQIKPFYQWMQVNIPSFVILSDKALDLQHSKH